MLPMVLGCFVLSLPTMTWVLTPDASFVPNSWFSLGFYPQWTCAGAAVAHLLGNLVGVLLSGALAGLLMWCAAAVTHWVLHANGPSSHALANSSACRPLLYAFTVPALMIIFQIGATVFMALLADSADEGARQRHQKSLANLRLRSYIRECSRALHV
jgi:hypothetical protein